MVFLFYLENFNLELLVVLISFIRNCVVFFSGLDLVILGGVVVFFLVGKDV